MSTILSNNFSRFLSFYHDPSLLSTSFFHSSLPCVSSLFFLSPVCCVAHIVLCTAKCLVFRIFVFWFRFDSSESTLPSIHSLSPSLFLVHTFFSIYPPSDIASPSRNQPFSTRAKAVCRSGMVVFLPSPHSALPFTRTPHLFLLPSLLTSTYHPRQLLWRVFISRQAFSTVFILYRKSV